MNCCANVGKLPSLSVSSGLRDGNNSSAYPLGLLKELDKANTCIALQVDPEHSESSMKAGCDKCPQERIRCGN